MTNADDQYMEKFNELTEKFDQYMEKSNELLEKSEALGDSDPKKIKNIIKAMSITQEAQAINIKIIESGIFSASCNPKKERGD